MANVLAVFAHPDDEVLGCGGTLAKHAEAGDEVRVVYGTHAYTKEHAAAAKTLGISDRWWVIGFPDQKADTIPFLEIVQTVESFGSSPDIIYTHHPGDLNLDHQIVAKAALTAFRPKPGCRPRTILACEVLSSTEYTYPRVFQPNWYEALRVHQVFKKQDAMACYPSELKEPRDKTGIMDQVRYRGAEVGTPFAEAFQLLLRGPM